MNYLDVDFYDNDFGRPMKAALKRLWGWVKKNNGHLVGMAPRTVPQMFFELHNCGALETMILRLFILEDLCYEVEFHTRGLYWETVDWDKLKIHSPTEIEASYRSFSCDVTLHENRDFANEWKNGEHAWLDLTTGACETY